MILLSRASWRNVRLGSWFLNRSGSIPKNQERRLTPRSPPKQGILHRDIKPSNLLLDKQGTVWVTDFGLAKAVDDQQNLTCTGDILGTLRYMSPEVFEGKTDARSDVYSLGLTLHEMLAFRPAFAERGAQPVDQAGDEGGTPATGHPTLS